MQYLLNLYASFSCLAGECPFTCCSGWEIEVSKQDYERFGGLEPVWLRNELLENIRKKGEKYYFKNLKNGDCAMLLKDGLCRIEKHTSERMLCNTCRKFPRIFGGTGEITAFSMAASCPVVAQAVCEDRLELFMETPEGFLPVSFSEVPFCREVLSFFRERGENYPQRKEADQENREKFLGGFSELSLLFADVLVELLLTSKTFLRNDLLELLSFYETDRTEESVRLALFRFCEEQRENYQRVKVSYIPYRIYSGWLEMPEEGVSEQYAGICGELFLFRFFGFLLFQRKEDFGEKEWEWVICLTYRIMVHEKKMGERLREFFRSHQKFIEGMI